MRDKQYILDKVKICNNVIGPYTVSNIQYGKSGNFSSNSDNLATWCIYHYKLADFY